MRTSGHWFFRWRSYLPLAFLPLMAWSIRNGEAVELGLGETAGELIEGLAISMVVLGQAIRILTVGYVTNGTSGRNTTGQIAERLNVTGTYSVVRNPLYLGNCLMLLGAATYTQCLWLVPLMALTLTLYYERIISAEEDFLDAKFGADYSAWVARTPAFLPRLSNWQAPELPFSWRMVIRREHPGIYGAILTLFLIDLGFAVYGAAPEGLAEGWLWIVGTATAGVLAVKLAKRHTRLLDIPAGR